MRGAIMVATALAVYAVCADAAHARAIDPDRVAKVKAAYLFNFLQFAEWPESAFAGPESPIVVCFVGDAVSYDQFVALVSDERIRGRAVQVRRTRYPLPPSPLEPVSPGRIELFRSELRQAHMMFVAGTEHSRLAFILDAVRPSPTLTVSDIGGFAESGGMLELVLEEGRIIFEANPGAIESSQVRVSSKVLRLARIVGRREGNAP